MPHSVWMYFIFESRMDGTCTREWKPRGHAHDHPWVLVQRGLPLTKVVVLTSECSFIVSRHFRHLRPATSAGESPGYKWTNTLAHVLKSRSCDFFQNEHAHSFFTSLTIFLKLSICAAQLNITRAIKQVSENAVCDNAAHWARLSQFGVISSYSVAFGGL